MDGQKRFGPYGPKQDGPLNKFSFSFFILLHHCEVTHKNNYFIYTNIFSKYNRLHIGCLVEVLTIF